MQIIFRLFFFSSSSYFVCSLFWFFYDDCVVPSRWVVDVICFDSWRASLQAKGEKKSATALWIPCKCIRILCCYWFFSNSNIFPFIDPTLSDSSVNGALFSLLLLTRIWIKNSFCSIFPFLCRLLILIYSTAATFNAVAGGFLCFHIVCRSCIPTQFKNKIYVCFFFRSLQSIHCLCDAAYTRQTHNRMGQHTKWWERKC